MTDPQTDHQRRLKRLELKVNAIIVLAIVQTILLSASLLATLFFPSKLVVLLTCCVVVVVGYVFRNQIPSVASRLIGKLMGRFYVDDNSTGEKTETDDIQDGKFK